MPKQAKGIWQPARAALHLSPLTQFAATHQLLTFAQISLMERQQHPPSELWSQGAFEVCSHWGPVPLPLWLREL